MNVTAEAERSGKWWAIVVPEIKHGYTQARRIEDIDATVKDLVNLATDTPIEDITVSIKIVSAELEALQQVANEVAQAQRVTEEATQRRRELIKAAQKTYNLSQRDIAALTGVTLGRVNQILKNA